MTFTRQRNLEERECTSCAYYIESYAPYEEGGYLEEIGCGKEGNERFGNLKTFPFKNRRSCHELDLWHSRFSGLFTGNAKHDNMVLALWRKSDSQGNLTPAEEQTFIKLQKDKDAKYGKE